MLPGEPEQRRARRLERLLATGEPRDGTGGERDPGRTAAGDHPALGVPRDQAGELGVEQVGVEDGDGEQVGGERQRIEAATEVGNVAEQRALEKAGFTREGVLRSTGWRDGAYRDGVWYSMLRSDQRG